MNPMAEYAPRVQDAENDLSGYEAPPSMAEQRAEVEARRRAAAREAESARADASRRERSGRRRYDAWASRRKAGTAASGRTQASPGSSGMSYFSYLQVIFFGAMDDATDILSGVFPGITSLVSGMISLGQVVAVLLDSNQRNAAIADRLKVLLQRWLIIAAVFALESIPVVAILPLQSTLVPFIIHMLKKKK